ncbi:MAG: ATP-binding protein [Candidatus Aminicenantes bacterium]|nr:ATP-binding protein [Candidatus Aminicenantes bacterium]
MALKMLKLFLGEPVADPGLKEQFERETRSLSREMLSLTCLIGMFLFPLFGTLDVIVFPRLYPVFWALRLIEVVVCAVLYALAKSKWVRSHPADAGMFLMIASCLNIVAMCWLTGGPTSVYYAGINLTILVVIFVMILDARRALLACAVVYAFFMLPLLSGSFDASQTAAIVSNNYFLLITMALAVLWTLIKNRTRLEALRGRRSLAKANEELKQLDALKSQFFANVSHEVRTPLTSILGPIASLYQGDAGDLAADQQALIETVYRNSLKLLDMINQMLDFSKIEAGKMPLRLTREDLGATLRETVDIFRPIAERKGIRLDFRPGGDVPAVDIDAGKFERVVTNLVRNALKFTDHGSILVTLRAEGLRIRLAVEDTGIGIAPEHLASIFERFHQVDGSSTRRYEGTGIGLTLVKEYVELMRGTISVTSELGRGTRFEIELPANLADLAPEAVRERRSAPSGRAPTRAVPAGGRPPSARCRDEGAPVSIGDLAWMEQIAPPLDAELLSGDDAPPPVDRVLLAEDNADLRAFLRTMLIRSGHDVVAVADGVEAWEAAERDLPDVIVSDLMMPRLDGYELLRKVKGTSATRQIPVILITAKPGLEAKLKGYEHGADAFIGKPVQIRELDARIRNLTAEHRSQLAAIRLKEMESREDERLRGFEKLRLALKSTVQSIAAVAEMRDPYTAGHQRRVADLALALGAERGLSADCIEGLHMAAMIHDIGKIRIPTEILSKPSKLTALEFELIKTHAQAGADILKGIDFPWPIARMILEHHERMDGSGYPGGLRGESLLPESRILAVADAVEAISTHRPYRPALGIEAALAEIEAKKGLLFDAAAVDACLTLFRQKQYSLPV